jgi:gamma-glutamyltranspeptidase/glutathione hydrolase
MTGKTLLAAALTLALTAAGARTPVATGTGGAVATISEPASRAAMSILNKGGNAVDAAVAAPAARGVSAALSCGIGGRGLKII